MQALSAALAEGVDQPSQLPPALATTAARAAAAAASASRDHGGPATPVPACAPEGLQAAAAEGGGGFTPPAPLDGRLSSTAAPRVQ